MNTTTRPSTSSVSESVAVTVRALSWGAIIAGGVAALGTHLLLTLLGLGLGMQTVNPLSDENPVAGFSVSAGIAWSISALISLWLGGWVAGRFAEPASRALGCLHGFIVWSAATIIMFFFLSTGAGLAVTNAFKLAGQGLQAAGQATASAAPAAGDAFQQFTQENGGIVSSFLDEAAPAQNDPAAQARARREIGWTLYRLFAQGGDVRSPENRTAVVNALTQYTGRSQADAERMVDQWIASYERVKQDLAQARDRMEQRAREIAERASDATTKGAIWTFLAFSIGAGAGIWGGYVGAGRWWNVDFPAASRDPFPTNR